MGPYWTKMAQDGPKIGQDGRKMAEDAEHELEDAAQIVKMRFRSDFGGQHEKKKSVKGPSRGPDWRDARPCSRLRLSGVGGI